MGEQELFAHYCFSSYCSFVACLNSYWSKAAQVALRDGKEATCHSVHKSNDVFKLAEVLMNANVKSHKYGRICGKETKGFEVVSVEVVASPQVGFHLITIATANRSKPKPVLTRTPLSAGTTTAAVSTHSCSR